MAQAHPAEPAQGTALDDAYVLPASFGQERLWFLAQLDQSSSGAYNVYGAVEVEGPLDRRALQDALNLIVARHESLRTALVVEDDDLRQLVRPGLRLALPVIELDGDDELPPRLAEEARKPFDLGRAPLLRVCLFRLGAERHVLSLVLHHAVADGWSVGIFVRELATAYAAFLSGGQARLPELEVQYADFAAWQREWLQGPELTRRLEYWTRQLSDLEPLELPTDRPRPRLQSFRGGRRRLRLAARLTQRLEALAHEEQATLYMVLLAASSALLARLSGQADFALGSPIANRTRRELEPLIGFFANTLVLRTNVEGDPSFRELLARVRETSLHAYEHQDMPFEKLVEELRPQRDLSRTPLFQVFLSLQNTPMPALELEGTRLRPLEVDAGTAMFELSLVFRPDEDGGLRCALDYNANLFSDRTAARILARLETLLDEVTADPDRRLSELPALPDEEQKLIERLAGGERADLPERCLHELIADQVSRTPDAIAVVAGEERLTYRALDERANRLAHRLRAEGAGAGTTVALCLNRSSDLPVALLAVLKTGAAYLPLDPAYPAERLAFMLADSGATLLVTHEGLLDALPDPRPRTLVLDRERLGDYAADSPPAAARPRDLAYVIYTSGSTGRPKGVEIEHRALLNFLASMARAPGLSGDDVLVAVTTLSFDIAGLELYLPLLTGGRVVLATRGQASDGETLASLLTESGATAMQATPATWRLLLTAGWRAPAGFKLLCGGEALPDDLAAQLLEGEGELWNLYGPTETTIWSTALELHDPPEPVPIGPPIANTTLRVLDERLRPAPLGAAGELFIGGAGLARGYRNRPALTAERFLPDPFAASGARLYRTGDRVRLRDDGTLEFLGRADDQLKLRGFRIEPAEIEAALRAEDGVDHAVVQARGEGDERRLVAYLAGAGERPPAAALRRQLSTRLPDYMLPATYVWLEQLPLTPNGKIDRRALPDPEGGESASREYVAPRTPVEQAVATLMAQTLTLERVGLDDDFFELGGHSLLATRLVGALRDRFQVSVPLHALFEQATVARLAELVERGQTADPALAGLSDDLQQLVEQLSEDEMDALLRDPLVGLRPKEETT
ncbi:MAG TPA: amino acid adenylation domain-containing protein [Gaiellaceae bacterium]